MRAGAVFLILSACSFDQSGIEPKPPVDGPSSDDGGGVPETFRADTAADFAPGTLAGTVIEPWGEVAPAPLLSGAFLARGSNQALFTDPTTATWDSLVAPSGTTVAALDTVDFGLGTPTGVGINDPDGWTYWLEGLIYLEAGQHRWELDADDAAFLDLAPIGGDFERVITATSALSSIIFWSAPTSDWYQARIAVVDDSLTSQLSLRHAGPTDALATNLGGHELIALAPVQGWLIQGFDESRLLRPTGLGLAKYDGLDQDFGSGRPPGLGLTNSDTYSVRWSGRVFIATAGAYQFRLQTDDGHRLWIDGVLVQNFQPNEAVDDRTTGLTNLEVGWHDLIVDLSENVGDASARLRVTAGPDLDGLELPLERLRPNIGTAERVAGGANDDLVVVPDQGSASSSVAIDAPNGATVTRVDVGISFAHEDCRELDLALISPSGTTVTLFGTNTFGNNSCSVTDRRSVAAFVGEAAAGAWTVRLRDSASASTGDTGGFTTVMVTVHYQGGVGPVPATTVSYESQLIDVDAVGFDEVSWVDRIPAGGSIVVRLKSCPDQLACASEPWSVPAVSGTAPPIGPGRFLQYKLELTSDGISVPAVDSIELRFRRAQ